MAEPHPGEVLTSMPTLEALMQAHIHALRQVGDNMERMDRRFEGMANKVEQLTESVIGLEKSGYDQRLASLKVDLEKVQAKHVLDLEKVQTQVDVLKSQRDQALGAMSLTGWLTKYAPWLLAGIAAFAAGAGLKLK